MFETDAMKTLDEILSHMNDDAYDIRLYSPIEKIVHTFHMKEQWAMILKEYNQLKANPPHAQVCPCVLDIENNDVLSMLRSIALLFREPLLIYGNRLQSYGFNSFGNNQEAKVKFIEYRYVDRNLRHWG